MARIADEIAGDRVDRSRCVFLVDYAACIGCGTVGNISRFLEAGRSNRLAIRVGTKTSTTRVIPPGQYLGTAASLWSR